MVLLGVKGLIWLCGIATSSKTFLNIYLLEHGTVFLRKNNIFAMHKKTSEGRKKNEKDEMPQCETQHPDSVEDKDMKDKFKKHSGSKMNNASDYAEVT